MDEAMMEALAQRALQVKGQAYAPYSQCQVGAAILSAAGGLYAGCNVECQTYSETTHAEEAARCAMVVAEGPGARIQAVAVTHMPCGRCRQIIYEHAASPALPIFIVTDGAMMRYTLDELLPHAFTL